MITKENILETFDYDAESGKLYWKARLGATRSDKSWNKKYAGNEAGWEWRNRRLLTDRPYNKVHILGHDYKVSRLVWTLETGNYPEMSVDHVNGDTLDDRFTNLRLATCSEQAINRGKQINNTSGCKGVCWSNHWKKWSAVIQRNKKTHFLGWFVNKEDAIAARLDAEPKIHGEWSRK